MKLFEFTAASEKQRSREKTRTTTTYVSFLCVVGWLFQNRSVSLPKSKLQDTLMRQVLTCISVASAAVQEPLRGITPQIFSPPAFEEGHEDVFLRANPFIAHLFYSDFVEDVDQPAPRSKPRPQTLALSLHNFGHNSNDLVDDAVLRTQEHPRSNSEPPHSKSKPSPKSKPSSKSKPSPSKSRPLQGDHVVLSEEAPVDYVYPSSPYIADDYDTLRAELQLLSTPHAEDYMQAYSMALSTVKGECFNDYISYCTTPVSVSTLGDDADGHYHLYSAVPDPNQIDLSSFVNSVLSLFLAFQDPVSNTNNVGDSSELPTPCDTDIKKGLIAEKLTDDFISPQMLSEPKAAYSESSIGGKSAFRLLPTKAVEYSENYLVPLGFGESGDVCLYAHYDMLAPGCKESISVVYEVHDQYLAEDEQSYHHGGFAALMLLVLLLWMSVRCCTKHCGRNAQKRMAEKSILKAIRADHSLKGRVEAAAGHSLPDADQPDRCCWTMCARIVVSAFIVLIAVLITCAIVQDMQYVDEEGNEHEPSVIVVFLIMLAIVAVIVGFLRFVHYLYLLHFSGGSPERGQIIQESRRRFHNAFEWSHRFFIPRHPTDYAVLSSDEVDDVTHGSELTSRSFSMQPNVVQGVQVAAFPVKHRAAGEAAPAQAYTNIAML